MTWPLAVLACAVAYVILGILVGTLLALRRELDEVSLEVEVISHRAEEIHKLVAEIDHQVHAARSEVAVLLTEMERVGGFK